MSEKITIKLTEYQNEMLQEIIHSFWQTSEEWAVALEQPGAKLPNGETPNNGTIMQAKRRANDAKLLADTCGVATGPKIMLVN